MKRGYKSKRGGKREGSGRHAVADPKVTVNLSVRLSKVAALGSKNAIRQLCYPVIDAEAARLLSAENC